MSDTWRTARSLDTIADQVNAAWPTRSRRTDGTIGDEAHRNRRSDHNPDSQGVVRARDITHDPAAGADMHVLFETLRQSRDPRIKYVIFSGEMFSSYTSENGRPAWARGIYTGENMHGTHLHLSVVPDDRADQDHPWQIEGAINMHTKKDHAVYHAQGPNPWGDAAWGVYVARGYTNNAASRTWEARREDIAWATAKTLEECAEMIRTEIARAAATIPAAVRAELAKIPTVGVDIAAVADQAANLAVQRVINRLTNG